MVEIKGSMITDAVGAYQERLPEEYLSVLARLDPETRALLADVQPNEWVPIELFIRYLQAQVDVTGQDPFALHCARAEYVADRQLHGLYRVFAKLSSPQALVARLSALDATYWRGVRSEREVVSKNHVIIRYRGLEVGHRLMEPIIVGFFRKVLQVNGAKDVKAEFAIPIGTPAAAELHLTWT